MADIVSGFLRATDGFLVTRMGRMTEESWHDSGRLLGSLTSFSSDTIKARWEELKADVEAMKPIAKQIADRIDKQTALIKKMVEESKVDIAADDFDVDQASRVAIRMGMALAAADEAYAIIARELAKDAGGTVNEAVRLQLMDLWNPWAQPFKNLGDGAGRLLDHIGKRLLGIDSLVSKLADVIELDREGGGFKLVAHVAKSGAAQFGPLRLDQASFEGFLQFSDREVSNPTEAEKPGLVQRGEKWFIGDVAILGLRLRTLLEPGLTSNPLLKKVMPGSAEPKTTTITAISLDTAQGLYLGDGRGNERAVLPVRFAYPGVELRELAFGLLRDPQRKVTGFELTTSIAGKFGTAVGVQVVGGGLIVDLGGLADMHQVVGDIPVGPRWPDAVGLRIQAGPVTGGGFIQRVERTYKIDGKDVKRIEFGGTLQLKIASFGVSAIVVLAPDPFSLVLVMGVRFPAAIELSWGFTLNGIGGILALERGLDLEALKAGMKQHLLDKMLFPDDPVSEAPALLDKVAHVFPPLTGGFVVGPIVELGWGSQAKLIKLKLGVVLALPDPMIVVLGSLSIQVPHEKAPITDIKADVFAAIQPDRLLMFATMRDSRIGGYTISGDLGVFLQWSGDGAFELSAGGFHPEYEKLVGRKPNLGALDRITLDMSPGGGKGPITFIVKAYFAVTAGSVQLGVDGRLNADFVVVTARAWLTLDMIFIWAPRFAFKVSIEVGAEVELLGFSFASVMLRGSFEGTQPFKLAGHVKIDVWFLPTFDEDIGPITWGDEAPPALPAVSLLQIASSALNARESWKAVLPEHAAQLVTLADVDPVDGLLAHPLAGLEVSQTQVPLGVKVTHVGASPVTADMVTLGTPVAGGLSAAAISELNVPFSPGHYFDLVGEALLARSGFEAMPGGCRIAAATVPVTGAARKADVAYRTYVRSEADDRLGLQVPWNFAAIHTRHVAGGEMARSRRAAANPYLARKPEPPVTVRPAGSSVLADAATGAALLAGLGPIGATQAAVIRASINAAAVAHGLSMATRVAVTG